MALDEEKAALRAKSALAKRHAADLGRQAREQRARTMSQRADETRKVDEARAGADLHGWLLQCGRCGAVWRTEAIEDAMRRKPVCLLCAGPLTPVP